MGRILDATIDFFQKDDWKFTRIAEKTILTMSVSAENGNFSCLAEAREEQKQLVFYAIYPTKVPNHKRVEAAEFITRANYGLVIGNFELDMRDGEVRYKTSIDIEDEPLTSSLVKMLVYINVSTADRYLPGLMSVIYGNLSPEQAIAQVEESDRAVAASGKPSASKEAIRKENQAEETIP